MGIMIIHDGTIPTHESMKIVRKLAMAKIANLFTLDLPRRCSYGNSRLLVRQAQGFRKPTQEILEHGTFFAVVLI